MKTINDFTNLYQLSKTMRFKLIPIGETIKHFMQSGILEEDEHRAKSYQEVKKIIDDYHKAYIDRMLDGYKLPYKSNGKLDSLEEYSHYYHLTSKSVKEIQTFKKIKANLRKRIVDQLRSSSDFKKLFKKELIQSYLPDFVKNETEAEYKTNLISEFKNFTVYFSAFHENRKNMYSQEEKSTAIAYRLIHENLPIFMDNISIFQRIAKTEISNKFQNIYKSFEAYLQVERLEDIFRLDYFSDVLTQKHIDVYNALIGGKVAEDGKKIQGLNELINLYNQHHKTERLPKLKMLFKQILSDREAISWLPDKYENDIELLSSVKEFYKDVYQSIFGEKSLKQLIETIDSYDSSRLFIRNDQQLSAISQKLTGSWGILSDVIKKHLESVSPRKNKETSEAYEERIDKLFKAYESFSLDFINQVLSEAGFDNVRMESYFKRLGVVDTEITQNENVFSRIVKAYAAVEPILTCQLPEGYHLSQDIEAVSQVKQLLDVLKELQLFVKPLLGSGEESDKDEGFYSDFMEYWRRLDVLTPLYNKVRNYVTKKPYSEEKIKLNFKNPTLLNGWDINKESAYKSFLLRKEGNFYLGIFNNKITFSKCTQPDSSFEKMEYHAFKDITTMIPKCSTQLKEVKAHFDKSNDDYILKGKDFIKPLVITKTIYELNNVTYDEVKKFQVSYLRNTGDIAGFNNAVETWIQFCMDFLNSYRSTVIYDYSSLKPLCEYKQLDSFYADVNKILYEISFVEIPEDEVMRFVKDGKLYLFQIYNKDFSAFSKGTPNMHTLYWRMLFDERNLADVVYKLNGEAEIFFRKASLEVRRPTHPAHVPLKNKNMMNAKTESVFDYDLIKDKRYTVDQFQLHVAITMNFKAQGTDNINSMVYEYIRQNDDVHIIGIDRGERHLLYLVVIDRYGKICEQYSLNEIVNEHNNNLYRTNYHDLLNEKESERLKARQNWQNIANIKELKEGYLSQVIHKISELMVKYNAIVVLEDLNSGFKRGRQKVEKQVYQKFERMLIEKLNYLVFKKQEPTLPGGTLCAYQLTNKFEGFNKLSKQSGFLFYIPAWNTSKIDPTTGFVNLFDMKYESVDKAKAFFSRFDYILYNAEKDWFEFAFDYDNFTKKAEGTKTKWVVCTYGTRIRTFRNITKNSQWDNEEIELTKAFKMLFGRYNIALESNLKDEILRMVEKNFFYELIALFKLTMQMRNSVTGTDIDYLVSPVMNVDKTFFDSRIKNDLLPQNADANGAYNIARKGLMLLKRIRTAEDLETVDLKISNKEWMDYAQHQ